MEEQMAQESRDNTRRYWEKKWARAAANTPTPAPEPRVKYDNDVQRLQAEYVALKRQRDELLTAVRDLMRNKMGALLALKEVVARIEASDG